MFRFSIREILLLTTVVTLVCALLQSFYNSERRIKEQVGQRAEELIREEKSRMSKEVAELKARLKENELAMYSKINYLEEKLRKADHGSNSYWDQLETQYEAIKRLRTESQERRPDYFRSAAP
jgi:hypothetical protein